MWEREKWARENFHEWKKEKSIKISSLSHFSALSRSRSILERFYSRTFFQKNAHDVIFALFLRFSIDFPLTFSQTHKNSSRDLLFLPQSSSSSSPSSSSPKQSIQYHNFFCVFHSSRTHFKSSIGGERKNFTLTCSLIFRSNKVFLVLQFKFSFSTNFSVWQKKN